MIEEREQAHHRGSVVAVAPTGWAPYVVVAAVSAAALSSVLAVWVVVLLAAAIAPLFVMAVRGHTAGGWIVLRCRYMRRRRQPRAALSVARHTQALAGGCGTRWDGGHVVSMIQLGPTVTLPTFIDADGAYTEDVVPLDVIWPLRRQYGLVLDIDITATGCKTVHGDAADHVAIDGQLPLGDRAVGQRTTWLVLRMDVAANLAELSRRGSVDSHAAEALATATLRLAQQLRQRGYRAEALPDTAMDVALGIVTEGVDPASWDELWTGMRSRSDEVVNYWIAQAATTTAALDTVWSVPARTVTTVVRLVDGPGGRPAVRTLVRYTGSFDPEQVPSFLIPAAGQQLPAYLASLPAGTRSAAAGLPVPETVIDLTGDRRLQIPVGPSGQLVGVTRQGATMVLSLFDPSPHNPAHLVVDFAASVYLLQQVTMRAVATGATVAVHTREPMQWRHLADMLNQPGRPPVMQILAPGHPPAAPVSIAICDGTSVDDGEITARTVIYSRTPDQPVRNGAEVSITQPDPTDPRFQIRIPLGVVDVAIVATRHDSRYIGELGSRRPSAPQPAPAGAVPVGVGARRSSAPSSPAVPAQGAPYTAPPQPVAAAASEPVAVTPQLRPAGIAESVVTATSNSPAPHTTDDKRRRSSEIMAEARRLARDRADDAGLDRSGHHRSHP